MRALLIFLMGFSSVSFASVAVTGILELHTSCPAYLSKNKRNNPDELRLYPKSNYEIKEINRLDSPTWLRIVVQGTHHPLRWVSAACGTYHYNSVGKNCTQLPNLADFYVLALSWLPGFCQTYGYEIGKPECIKLKATSFPAKHLVLHGLWPSQERCRENYGFCGIKPRKNHCDYADLLLTREVAEDLQKFMPSYAAGSCLERHEWNKHGSCQTLSTDAYFSLAMRLNQEANNTPLGKFLRKNVGKTIKRSQLQKIINLSFGSNALNKVHFGCKNGVLVDILIQLPSLIPQPLPLAELIQQAPYSTRRQGCPEMITISNFHPEVST